jgi:hypothetical protein
MTCPHQSQPPGKDTGRRICAIGLYGGKPFVGNCNACVKAGENTLEFADQLKQRGERSHPSTRNRISGCCDRADQS